MKRLLFVLISMAVFTSSCRDETQGSNTIEVITAEEMKEISKIEDVQLIDVRTQEEYEEGYIEGFQNIDYYSDDFTKDIEKLDKSKPVIVYCKSGNRSGKCAKKMEEAGFSKVYDLEGGITQWKFKGFEVKKKS